MKICCKCKQPTKSGFFVGRNQVYCRECYIEREAELEQRAGEDII